MNRMSLVFILAVIILGAKSSWAVDLSTSGIYRATKEACSKVKPEDLLGLNLDRLRAGFFPSREYTELLGFLRRSGTRNVWDSQNFAPDTAVELVLTNSGFQQALDECYPQATKSSLNTSRAEMIHFFEDSIKSADRRGRIFGGASLVLVFSGYGKIVGMLKSSLPRVYRALTQVERLGFVTYLTAQLTSDSVSRPKTVDSSVVLKPLEEAAAKARKTNDELPHSLELQIAEIDKQIYACGECSQKKILLVEHQALTEVIAAIRAQNLNQ